MLVIAKVLACIQICYSQFFSNKKWAEFEMKKWVYQSVYFLPVCRAGHNGK